MTGKLMHAFGRLVDHDEQSRQFATDTSNAVAGVQIHATFV
jgi:hypothetical protein